MMTEEHSGWKLAVPEVMGFLPLTWEAAERDSRLSGAGQCHLLNSGAEGV